MDREQKKAATCRCANDDGRRTNLGGKKTIIWLWIRTDGERFGFQHRP